MGDENWGVDDGFGYMSYAGLKTSIAFYHHWGVWHGTSAEATVRRPLRYLQEAYVFTGDNRYGRLGAILVDRIADLYPDFNQKFNPDGFMGSAGKITDYIWENGEALFFAKNYDAFYPAFDDTRTVNFVKNKAETYNISNNPKSNGNYMRQNCEDGILRETEFSVRNGQIIGNFGMYQETLITSACIIDRKSVV